MTTEERRAQGAARFPFDALVEVGGALGPSFEAHAANVSEEGILLRTAYLPEVGQPLTCRFDAGPERTVLASGEVVWAHGVETGGEFAVRFTDVDAESAEALKKICEIRGNDVPVHPGSKVRLHIDGLASPMRAKIKGAGADAVTVGSDLGFLQVGRQLELEDAQSGNKRPASIDRVEVAVDPASQVPQLVVTLRYSDRKGVLGSGTTKGSGVAPAVTTASPHGALDAGDRIDDLDRVERATARVKGIFEHGASRIVPAANAFGRRLKTMVGLLRRAHVSEGRIDEGSLTRRTTAPPPGGGLHSTGRRVFRSDAATPSADPLAPRRPALTKRRVLLASGVMTAAVLLALAMKTWHHEPPTPSGSGLAVASASAAASASPAAAVAAPSASPSVETLVVAPSAPTGNRSTGDGDDTDSAKAHAKHARATPFGNGPVHHGIVLHLHMDGPVETIEGAQQPTGFTVKIPGRKAVEAAGPLQARDARIAAIKVSNDAKGAELTVAFKDGVPNYRVSARGDTLVIALAPPGGIEQTLAKKDENGVRSAKHSRSRDGKKGDRQF